MTNFHEAQPGQADLMLPSLDNLSNEQYLERSRHFGEAWTRYASSPEGYDYAAVNQDGEAADFFRDLDAVLDDAGIDNADQAPTILGLPDIDYDDRTDAGRITRATMGIWNAAREKGLVPDAMATGRESTVDYYNDRVALNLVQARTIAAGTAGEQVLSPGLLGALYKGPGDKYAYEGGTEDKIADRISALRRSYRDIMADGIIQPADIVLGVMEARSFGDVEQHFLRMKTIIRSEKKRAAAEMLEDSDDTQFKSGRSSSPGSPSNW